MGKKKKDFKNIKINLEGLSITTIGELPNEQKGPIFVLILFALLLIIVFFLPSIVDYINDKSAGVVESPNINKLQESIKPDETNKIVFYDLNADLNITLNEVLTINNFEVSNNQISFDITNKGENRFYFNRYNYFMELYTEDNTLLERVILKKEGISKDISKSYIYEINPNTASLVKKIVFVNISTDGYFNVELTNDTLTCFKDSQTITYKFADNKLTYISDYFNYSNKNDVNYSTVLSNYQNQVNNYNSINGIKSTLVESNEGFTINTDLDLNTVDKSKINNDNYYALNTDAKIVSFEMEARGFSCN